MLRHKRDGTPLSSNTHWIQSFYFFTIYHCMYSCVCWCVSAYLFMCCYCWRWCFECFSINMVMDDNVFFIQSQFCLFFPSSISSCQYLVSQYCEMLQEEKREDRGDAKDTFQIIYCYYYYSLYFYVEVLFSTVRYYVTQ